MSNNKENIPLDQMMRKLKSSATSENSQGTTEGGQRVIREDGSVAIKVKSKKRRTNQPKKTEEKKSNKVKIILLSSLITLILLSGLIIIILLGYYNGSRFKSQLSQTLVNTTGAEVELGKLEVSHNSASIIEANLNWSGGNTLLKELKLKKIKADYNVLALVGGGWRNSSVNIAQADLELETATNNPQLELSAERPLDLQFNLFHCSELNIDFGSDSLWGLKNASVAYRVNDQNDQFNVDSGDFTVPRFGKFKINTGIVTLSNTNARIYLDLKSEEQTGSLNVDGTVGYTEGGLLDLNLGMKNYPLKDWIDPRARRFFNGKIYSSEGKLKMNLGDIESLEIEAEIYSKTLSITDFPFIKAIAEQIPDDFYQAPEFTTESKMTVKMMKNNIAFSAIDLLQLDQMRIKGNFSINQNDQLSGVLNVGLPLTVISRNKGDFLKKTFTTDDGDYLWTSIILSGDVANPKDNFAQMSHSEPPPNLPKKDKQEDPAELKFKQLTE